MNFKDVAIVRRDVEVTLIPYGQSITLMPGQEVLVTQALGGSYTLNVNGNLVRLEGKDADAIGKEVVKMPVDDSNVKPGDPIDEDLVWAQLSTVYDPEIPVNIVDLGLIYDLHYTPCEDGNYHVGVQMTLTAPGCGMGPVLVEDVETRLKQIPNINAADVVLVFDPPWNSDMMSEEAKLELGLF
ncbi:putative Fe-S cluster assembly protein SufT [Thiotrichales bacterium 19S3-7]|nr:putative Fe-S cluster assembly protein SufT [Thiotrichales bacterium 19S3-7]MCF6801392.1 putative Fe-S cluster assembly protein SufT [Thiotrichales bacterium 19S3-11]